MSRKRLGIALFAALLAAAAIFMKLGCTPPAEVVSPAELALVRPNAQSLVVVYSRSGNTARAARTFADELGASYQRLQGRKGDGDHFFSTPSASRNVAISPSVIDLKPYRLILIGTPIWYSKPTAHILTFVRTHRFDGKRVVLFYTYEGSVHDDAIASFRQLVRERGGELVDVVAIDRDALGDGETVESRAHQIAAERKQRWLAAETKAAGN